MEHGADEQQRAGYHSVIVTKQQPAERGGNRDQGELHRVPPAAAKGRAGGFGVQADRLGVS
jgi:hypothetical protein